MIAVIFEVEIADGQRDAYLDIAADLRTHLDQVDGFISVERFQSLTNPEKLLSLSYFEDETAVEAWRNLAEHRTAQSKGRNGVFAGYDLKVAEVLRSYSMTDRDGAPPDSKNLHG